MKKRRGKHISAKFEKKHDLKIILTPVNALNLYRKKKIGHCMFYFTHVNDILSA